MQKILSVNENISQCITIIYLLSANKCINRGGNVHLVPNSFGIGVDFTSPYSFEGYYGVHF